MQIIQVRILFLVTIIFLSFTSSGLSNTTYIGPGESPDISADGRFVVFHSNSSSIVPNDTNGKTDVFVLDRQTGETSLVSVASDGAQGNNSSEDGTISNDGRYVVFKSAAGNLDPADTSDNSYDIFLHDRLTGETSMIALTNDGSRAAAYVGRISGNGQVILFESKNSNIVSGDTNNYRDYFTYDRATGETSRVSLTSNGTQAAYSSAAYMSEPSMLSLSEDGRIVTFASFATNMVPNDTNGIMDVFTHDRTNGETSRVSIDSSGGQIDGRSIMNRVSGSGRFVAMSTEAAIVPNDMNGETDVYLHDRFSGETVLISESESGFAGDRDSFVYSISYDGRYVVFRSRSSNLVFGDYNDSADIFVKDTHTGRIYLVSLTETLQPRGGAKEGNINDDGRFVVYQSLAGIFLYDMSSIDSQSFSLSFPLANFTSQSAPFSSVFDHSMGIPYTMDQTVTSYSGEIGNQSTIVGDCDCYSNIESSAFNINGNYKGTAECGGTQYLCYDGHPGTDYPVEAGTLVYAAADGIAHLPASFPGITTAQMYNTIEIDHQNGYKTYYMHLGSQNISDGQQVEKGKTVIGTTGDVGSPGAYHLHFEVQYNGIPVDPYGWFGVDADPYSSATNVNLWNDRFVGYSGTGKISQTPLYGSAGTEFTQSGISFTPFGSVTLYFRNPEGDLLTPLSFVTDTNGSFTTNYTVPADKPVGTYTWWAVDEETGRSSAPIHYAINEISGGSTTEVQNGELEDPPQSVPMVGGTLRRVGDWDPSKETFIIVHGWNRKGQWYIPEWVTAMAFDIRNNPDSLAYGSNVFFWEWLERAESDSWFPNFSDDCGDIGLVPFDETESSGHYLAIALDYAIPKDYVNNVHMIGHSLGSLVITHATEWAKDHDGPYDFDKTKINHLVFLDSPCHLGRRPGGDFLSRPENSSIFIENYISGLGKIGGFDVSDVEINLYVHSDQIPEVDSHSYSYEWYRSSITGFKDDTILGDNSVPTRTPPYGFYWWKESNRPATNQKYMQKLFTPQWELYSGTSSAYRGTVFNKSTHTGSIAKQTWDDLVEFAENTGQNIHILAANTFNDTADILSAIKNEMGHAMQKQTLCAQGIIDPCGLLLLEHASQTTVDLPLYIPSGANNLILNYAWNYASPDSLLEIFINDTLLYSLNSNQTIGSGYKLTPCLRIDDYADQEVTLTFRLANKAEGTAGSFSIDDVIIAKMIDALPAGDVNGDKEVTLRDSVVSLQELVGIHTGELVQQYIESGADVNDDGQLGLAETISILDTLAAQ